MSPLESFATYAVIAAAIAVAVISLAYRKFKWGIPTRIYSMVCAVAIVTGTGGRVAGGIGDSFTWWHRAVILAVIIPLLGLISYGLYKMVISEIQLQVKKLVESSKQISIAASEVAATAAEQRAIVDQVSSAVTAINLTSSEASGAAHQVLEMSTETVHQGRAGQQSIDEAAKIMGLVKDIADIVDTVGNLAEQSNILAINAGIEAANAGEQGRGFSTVAEEIRRLASHSKAAADQIRTAVEYVLKGRNAIDESSAIVSRLADALEKSAEAAGRIAVASSRQSTEIQHITQSMGNVAEGGQNTTAAAQSLEDALATLGDIASALHRHATGQELKRAAS